MRRTPLAAMLTMLAAVLAAFALAGCGGKESSGSKATSTSTSTSSTPGVHKKPPSEPSKY